MAARVIAAIALAALLFWALVLGEIRERRESYKIARGGYSQ